MKELIDTIDNMKSENYKDRFKAEYYQLKIRIEKLKNMLTAWDFGILNFEPSCPRHIYDRQLSGMTIYLEVLRERSKIENIDLEED